MTTTTRRIAIRMSYRTGWERYNNFTGEWWTLPFVISSADQNTAREFVAALYGVRPRDVEVDPAVER